VTSPPGPLSHRPPAFRERGKPGSASVPPALTPVGKGEAFDALAPDYDTSFTATPLGTLLRQAVWRRLDASFAPGQRVLELGCGTGEDAAHLASRRVHVLATDASPVMVETARRKVAAAGLGDLVEVRRMSIEDMVHIRVNPEVGEGLAPSRVGGGREGDNVTFPPSREGASPSPTGEKVSPESASSCLPSPGDREGGAGRGAGGEGPFDGAFSNFGGLNCVADLGGVARGLAALLPPGAPVLLCVMGPLVPWEWIWYLGRLRPGTAFRRLRPGGVVWRGITVRYPSIRTLRRAFSPAFRLRRLSGVGAFLPPTYAEEWTRRHPHALSRLDRWERRFASLQPFPWLADHYLAELVRT